VHKTARKNTWSLQDAKARFSEVVRLAETQGPQHVTRHGGEAVVILSIDEYQKLKPQRKKNLVEVLLSCPVKGEDWDLSRDKSLPREIEF